MFQMRDLVKVKLKANKKSIYEYEKLFSSKIDRSTFFKEVILCNRKNVNRLEVEVYLKGKIARVVYDDYSKFDVSEIDMFYINGKRKLNGSYSRWLFELKEEGTLQNIAYKQVDNEKSELLMEFENELGFGYFKEDMLDYLEYDNEHFFSTIEIFERMVINLALPLGINKSIDGFRGIMSEFLLNLAQHSVRGNGYIQLKGEGLHNTIGGGGNIVHFLQENFHVEDVEIRVKEIKDSGFEEVEVLESIFKRRYERNISKEEKYALGKVFKKYDLSWKYL